MGAKGSGRRPSADTLLRRSQEVRQPVADDIWLPNLSGVKREALVSSSEDIKSNWTSSGNDIYNSNSGNVGIGTTSPDTTLEIAGAHISNLGLLHLDSTDHALVSLDTSDSAKDSGLYFSEAGTPQMSMFFDGSENELVFVDNIDSSARRMVIEQTGKVGIGTTSPGSLLEVKGDNKAIELHSNDYSLMRFGSAGSSGVDLDAGSILIREDGANKIQLRANGDVYFNTGGNVGIGTTSPQDLLHVEGSSGVNSIRITSEDVPSLRLYSTNANAGTRNWLIGTDITTFGDFHIRQSDAKSGDPRTAGTSRLMIDESGNVGIGTTNPDSPLQVIGTIRWDGLASSNGGTAGRYGSYTNTGGTSYFGVDSSAGGFTGTAYAAFVYTDSKPIILAPGGAAALTALTNGNVGIGTASPQAKLHVSGAAIFTNASAPSPASNEGGLFVSGAALWFLGGAGTYTLVASA